MLYTLQIESKLYNREVAVKQYKKLQLIRKSTAYLVNDRKKAGLGNGDLICSVNELKYSFNQILPLNSKILVKREGYELIKTYLFDIEGLKNQLNELRLDIRFKRQRNKDFRLIDVHSKPGYWFQQQINKAFENKRPKIDCKEQYLGIEIECIVPVDFDYRTALFPYRQFLSIGNDGSIDTSEFNENDCGCGNEDCDTCNNGQFEGKEFRLLIKESEMHIIEQVCQILSSNGVQVNKSCGLHVHFDLRNTQTNSEREDVYQKLYHALPLLYSIVPPSRRHNQYCRKNTKNKPEYKGTRYKAINATAYYKHHTFEIRLFNGTIQASKIINWIKLLKAIITGKLVLRCPKSFDTAKQYWNLSEDLVGWCKARQNKWPLLQNQEVTSNV